MKRIASIQDFSCFGRCSQTVALPVLSAMGVECAALPTAILSTHTAFDGFICYDMTDRMPALIDHWEQIGLRFDAIYTGYLASAAQIALVEDFFERFGGEGVLRFVDPVMADHGKLYAGFPADFPNVMRRLCTHADIITPNVTEACLLTGLPYREAHDAAYTQRLLEALLALGCKTAVVTGLQADGQHMSVAAMDADGKPFLHTNNYVPAMFHGTGDLFAASCVGAILNGCTVEKAIALAADYVAQTIAVTLENPSHAWYGVDFETTLPNLVTKLK